MSVIKVSLKAINSYPAPAKDVPNGIYEIVDNGPVWGQKKGLNIPTLIIQDTESTRRTVSCSGFNQALRAGKCFNQYVNIEGDDCEYTKGKKFAFSSTNYDYTVSLPVGDKKKKKKAKATA